MKTEETVLPRSISPVQDNKEIEVFPRSPPTLHDDNKDKHHSLAPTARRRPLSLTWKGLKSSLSGYISSPRVRILCIYTYVGVQMHLFLYLALSKNADGLYIYETLPDWFTFSVNAVHIQAQEAPESLPKCTPVKGDAESLDLGMQSSSDVEPSSSRNTALRPFSFGPTLTGYFSDSGSRKLFNSTGPQHVSEQHTSSGPECTSSGGCNFSKTAPVGILPVGRLAYRKASSRGGNSEIIYDTDIDMSQRDGAPQRPSDIRVQRHRRRVRVKGKKEGRQHKQKKGKRRWVSQSQYLFYCASTTT